MYHIILIRSIKRDIFRVTIGKVIVPSTYYLNCVSGEQVHMTVDPLDVAPCWNQLRKYLYFFLPPN